MWLFSALLRNTCLSERINTLGVPEGTLQQKINILALCFCNLKFLSIFARSNASKALDRSRRDAGVVDRGGLENRYTFGYPGFESLSLR